MLLFPDINVNISGRSLSSRPAAFLFPRPASHWGLAPAASPLTGVWLRRIASRWGLALT